LQSADYAFSVDLKSPSCRLFKRETERERERERERAKEATKLTLFHNEHTIEATGIISDLEKYL
jgi:hypothetical protein